MEINFNHDAMKILNNATQTAVNENLKNVEDENLFDGFMTTNKANEYTEVEEGKNVDVVDIIIEKLPDFISTLVNTILEQLGIKTKPSEPKEPQKEVVENHKQENTLPQEELNKVNSEKLIEQLETKKSQLEADKHLAVEKYAEKMNNRTLMLSVWASPNALAKQKVELTYDNLTSGLNGSTSYRVVDPNSGKIACVDIDKDVHRFINAQQYNATYDPKEGLVWNDGATDENKAAYQAAVAEMKANMVEIPDLNNPVRFQDMLQTGALSIEKQNVTIVENSVAEKNFKTEWVSMSLGSIADISSELYTDDDNAAMAEYDYTMSKIDKEIEKINVQIVAEKAETPEIKELELKKLEIIDANQKASEEYVEALNNRHMMLSVWTSPNAVAKQKVELTFDNLTSGLNGTTVYRVVKPNSGKIACTNIEKDVHRFINHQAYNASYDVQNGLVWNEDATDENKAAYQAAVAEMKANMVEIPDLNNPVRFQDMLQTGALSIENQNVITVENPVIDPETGEQRVDENNNLVTEKIFKTEWVPMSLGSIADISSELYIDDDNAAMAKYEHVKLLNQAKMKELDVKIAEAKEKYADSLKEKEEKPVEEKTVEQKDYKTRQVERYEKYIEKYEKQIEKLENSDDVNKQAKIASLMNKIEKYMDKINQIID